MTADDELPWNTTRCNRLLRPLSSKLAKLRKELGTSAGTGRESHSAPVYAATKTSSPRKTTTTAFVQPARKPRGLDKAKDPDWAPGAKLGATKKKTYGGRKVRKATNTQSAATETRGNARPGEIAFTPFVARTVGGSYESPQVQASPLRRYTKNRGPLAAQAEQIQKLKQQMPAHIEKLVKGMMEAYANLLQATQTSEARRWKGTRSLMSSCLRKIPAYIELEEHFARLDKEEEDLDEDRDVSDEVYTHLELQYEVCAGQGWRPFKQVLRAHGTSLMCDAFAEQLLGIESLQLLLTHCLYASAWDEAEKLLCSFTSALKPLPTPTNTKANLFDDHKSKYMWLVKEFVERTHRYSFLYDQLEYMISQELLPLEWLATDCMRPLWDRLIRTLSDGDHRTLGNVFRFLETAIYAGIGLPDESLFDEGEIDVVSKQLKPSARDELRTALDTTFSSLLTVLCSIALVNRNRDDSPGERIMQQVTNVLDSLVIGLLRRKDLRIDLELLSPSPEDMQTYAQRATWLVFTSFLLRLDGCYSEPPKTSLSLSSLTTVIQWVAHQYSSTSSSSSKDTIDLAAILATLPPFISSASRATGRIWKDDGFDQLQRLVHSLTTLSGYRLPHKLWTLKRLALESAMEFAHSTTDPQHMVFARGIEKKMQLHGQVVIMPSPLKGDTPSAPANASAGGFKWLEGIGEWVACTPFARQNARVGEKRKRGKRAPVRQLKLAPHSSQQCGGDDDDDDVEGGVDSAYASGLSSDLVDGLGNDGSVGEGATTVRDGQIDKGTADDVDDEDEEDDFSFPLSSPVRKRPRLASPAFTSTTFAKSRNRAPSPRVVIPSNSTRSTTTTSTPPRRSSRPRRNNRQDLSTFSSDPLSRPRARNSLENGGRGLRAIQRKQYNPPSEGDEEEEDTESMDITSSTDAADKSDGNAEAKEKEEGETPTAKPPSQNPTTTTTTNASPNQSTNTTRPRSTSPRVVLHRSRSRRCETTTTTTTTTTSSNSTSSKVAPLPPKPPEKENLVPLVPLPALPSLPELHDANAEDDKDELSNTPPARLKCKNFKTRSMGNGEREMRMKIKKKKKRGMRMRNGGGNSGVVTSLSMKGSGGRGGGGGGGGGGRAVGRKGRRRRRRGGDDEDEDELSGGVAS